VENDQVVPMTREWRDRIMQANNELAQNGMRVLGLPSDRLRRLLPRLRSA
jgi:hypothetical protein